MKLFLLLPFFLFVSSIALCQDLNVLLEEGIALHDQGKYKEAVEKYLELIKLEPKNGTAYYEASFSYQGDKDFDNALKMADKAIEYGNDQVRLMAMVVKGSVLDDSGREQEALVFYESAIKEFPNQYLLLFNYGVTLSGMGKIDAAEKAYIEALANNFGHPGTHLQLARLNFQRNSKAKSSMSLYFFLLVENQSARSAAARKDLLRLIYGDTNDSTKTKQIYLTLPGKGSDSDLTSAELFFSLMGPVSEELAKKNGPTTRQQRFVNDTRRYFKVLSDLANNESKDEKKAKKKRKADNPPPGNFWKDSYIRFYSDMLDAEHVDAFCYHIMKGSEDPEVAEWTQKNTDKMDRFYLWLKTR